MLAGLVVLTACGPQAPEPTPYPTPAPTPQVDDAPEVATAFLSDWRFARWGRLYESIYALDRERFDFERVSGLLASFDELALVEDLAWELGSVTPIVLPPQPRPPDQPAPSPSPRPSGQPTEVPAAPTAEPGPTATPIPPDTPLDGPVPALSIPVTLQLTSQIFGQFELDRELVLVAGPESWQVRWSPGLLFPELGPDGVLELTREDPVRGRILASDGTILAQTRDDGVRIYPQEWLAGQTIGYATPATPEDVANAGTPDLREGQLVGRAGLELGADDLLRGRPGFTLWAVPTDGERVAVLERPMEPGADIVTTLRPSLQAVAQSQIANVNEAGTAVIDPRTGDVWALASAPLFNPNAMTLGTTVDGRPLGTPGAAAIRNHATQGTYPTGSSFKVFTLAAALKTGVATPATRMTCSPTWTFSGFTFRNYLNHTLPGLVDLLQAMAFSCNTTYMPLSIMVYEKDPRALTDLLHEFGFGEPSGIRFVPEEPGQLPDWLFYEGHKRWHGGYSPYGPFDQIQLSIGQGEFLGSPLQLANAYAAIGNGGTLWTPRIVTEARLPDGTVIETFEPTVKREISVSDEHLDYVVESMKAVVNYSYGTGFAAFRGFGIQVAGKSGTAETGGPNPNAWFPAIAPADDPQISVATVLVRYPLGTGGDHAAPLVRRVMAQFFSE
ncbi:MAG TPA: penicillin-binding transpeptidase domain-containing protein [candidate division Zixibacteria bacterium]|nr:penicillin-binding transpeptidase domain-containing protein [candidate division Zixibacteria bacterium]